ncbi:MAG TPA: hypothetical protein VGR35_17300 [Tepidisphaeraceae bacterium]|nr:hypothetical protein [Tepidisphaeraceae bacterium]
MSSLPQPLPPVPVQPIAYSTPVNQRPTLITAIGVISIVVASLSLLFNGVAGLQAMGMVMVSQMTRSAANARQAAVVAAQAPPPKPLDPLAMPPEDRQTVLRGLTMHRPISKPRRDQLDALLASSGRQIFRLSGSDLTVSVVQQSVTESGRLPDAKGGEGSDFFIVGEGRIELADDHAKFVPDDGREIVRVDASETSEQPNWQAGLTPAQVEAIIDKIEQQSGQTLTPALRSKLQTIFSSPAQGFFDPVATIPEATGQIQSVNYWTNAGANGGQLVITTGKGSMTLDGAGNVQNSMTWGGAGAPGFAGPAWNINVKAAITAIICAVLSLGLAIYLLVIGILMLRQHPRAGRLHKIYAWVKIPVAIVGGIAWVLLWTSFATLGTGTAPAATSPGFVIGCIVAVLAGCAYPIAILIALRTRAVREYYATVT